MSITPITTVYENIYIIDYRTLLGRNFSLPVEIAMTFNVKKKTSVTSGLLYLNGYKKDNFQIIIFS